MIAFPKRQNAALWRRQKLAGSRVLSVNRLGQMAHQATKEFPPDARRSTYDNRLKRPQIVWHDGQGALDRIARTCLERIGCRLSLAQFGRHGPSDSCDGSRVR